MKRLKRLWREHLNLLAFVRLLLTLIYLLILINKNTPYHLI